MGLDSCCRVGDDGSEPLPCLGFVSTPAFESELVLSRRLSPRASWMAAILGRWVNGRRTRNAHGGTWPTRL